MEDPEEERRFLPSKGRTRPSGVRPYRKAQSWKALRSTATQRAGFIDEVRRIDLTRIPPSSAQKRSKTLKNAPYPSDPIPQSPKTLEIATDPSKNIAHSAENPQNCARP